MWLFNRKKNIKTKGRKMKNILSEEEIKQKGYETITLAGGCFWCTEAVFAALKGVQSVMPGYAGGHVKNPSYNAVCAGTTGHAECAQIIYDPKECALDTILDVHFKTHDPTTLNRQGNDVGTQYRSVIFYTDAEQKKAAEEYLAALDASGYYDAKIVTEIKPLDVFYPAETYHQDYFANNPDQAYCVHVVAKKVDKFHRLFPDKVKTDSL